MSIETSRLGVIHPTLDEQPVPPSISVLFGDVGRQPALAYFDEADATPDPELLDERLSWTQTRRRLTEAVRSFASGNPL